LRARKQQNTLTALFERGTADAGQDIAPDERERVILVHQQNGQGDGEGVLDELQELVESAGALVCGSVIGHRRRPDPATYIGSGKAQEISELVRSERATLLVMDHAISPIQERNLEKSVGCRVVDRAGLILDIFAQRATSKEGKLQVELAQLEYLSSRLVRGWTHLERQKGGIGLRGPGETQLETDRRLIGRRIKSLSRQLDRVSAQRELRRKSRRKVPIATISLVGYTNAGKSSLFNALTNANVFAADKLFATLDPTMRRLRLEGYGAVILSDTVGFIRDLPHSLVSAFHSTLEEVSAASLLLHVVDTSNPEHDELQYQVEQVLDEIDAADVPRITVFNKIDATGQAPQVERDKDNRGTRVWVSAQTGVGLDLLNMALAEHLGRHRIKYRLRLPPQAGKLRATLFDRCEVVSERVTNVGDMVLDLVLDQETLGWLENHRDFRTEYRC
jgi:GTP-binding protein HflX